MCHCFTSFLNIPHHLQCFSATKELWSHQMMDDAPLVATAWPAQIQNVTQKRQQLSQLLPWLCSLADVLLLSY